MTIEQPRLLILETSGRVGQVGLAVGARLLSVRRLDEARRHARDLVPAVGELLTAQGWKPKEIQGVIVSRGPGSYTGLRVGIMSAKTFAYTTGCGLLAVDTFAAIAAGAPADLPCLEVIADAQQERVYMQRFVRIKGQGWEAETPLAIRPLADWQRERRADVWVSGPGLQVYKEQLRDCRLVVDSSCWDPEPRSLLEIALPRYLAGETDDLWSLEPLYLRPSAAEEKWTNRSSS